MNRARLNLFGSLALTWLFAVLAAVGVYAYMAHLDLRHVRETLMVAPRVEAALAAQELHELRLRADHLAMDPAFVDYVAQSLVPNPSLGNAIDSTSIADLLNARRKGYDLAMVLDPDGKPAARSGTLLDDDTQLRADPAIAQVIKTLQPVQEVRAEQGHIILVVAEPLLRGGALQGVLFTARELGSAFAKAIAGTVGAGIALVTTPAQDATAMPESGLSQGILAAIRDSKVIRQSKLTRTQLIDLRVAGPTLPALAAPLLTRGGQATLVALDPGFDPMSAAAGTAWPLWLGILVLAGIASGLAVLRWRRTDAPLEQICTILERGVQGDHELVIPSRGAATPWRLGELITRLFAQMSDAGR
ncbi:MAG: hypothetical protein EPN36_08240 [Rhodanobacteraceae bacterium]|nr:MAG: hypothetical protein EPN36_08240 [Rhodanobacteraceae bacterium]